MKDIQCLLCHPSYFFFTVFSFSASSGLLSQTNLAHFHRFLVGVFLLISIFISDVTQRSFYVYFSFQFTFSQSPFSKGSFSQERDQSMLAFFSNSHVYTSCIIIHLPSVILHRSSLYLSKICLPPVVSNCTSQKLLSW